MLHFLGILLAIIALLVCGFGAALYFAGDNPDSKALGHVLGGLFMLASLVPAIPAILFLWRS